MNSGNQQRLQSMFASGNMRLGQDTSRPHFGFPANRDATAELGGFVAPTELSNVASNNYSGGSSSGGLLFDYLQAQEVDKQLPSRSSLNNLSTCRTNQPPAMVPQHSQDEAKIAPLLGDPFLDNGASDFYAQQGILGPWSERSASLLGSLGLPTCETSKKAKKKKNSGVQKPKRPLSAYNIFFKEERQKLIGSAGESSLDPKAKRRPHGKIGFENLAKIIAHRWQNLPPSQAAYYKEKAEQDRKRYREEKAAFEDQATSLTALGTSQNSSTNPSSQSEHVGIVSMDEVWGGFFMRNSL